jgi:hypothetical protein
MRSKHYMHDLSVALAVPGIGKQAVQAHLMTLGQIANANTTRWHLLFKLAAPREAAQSRRELSELWRTQSLTLLEQCYVLGWLCAQLSRRPVLLAATGSLHL